MTVDPAVREAMKGFPLSAKIALAVEVARLYVLARWLLVRRGLQSAVGALRGGLRAHSAAGSEQLRFVRGARFGHAVIRVLRVLPADDRCLMRSLVLTGLLARRGVYAKLVIGVRPNPTFAAHAWVEVDGLPVLEANEQEYHRLLEL